MRPRLLDLYCGPGLAARGYHAAGWKVTGVDIEPQPHFPYTFVWEGALGYLERLLYGLSKGTPIPFEGIHASPPCFKFSSITAVSGQPESELDLIASTRELLRQTGLPWVIENVPRSPLIQPYVVCGSAMACRTIDDRYRLKRHRHFETSFPLLVPPCTCAGDHREVLGVYGGGTSQATRVRANLNGGNTNKANTRQARELFGLQEPLPRTALNLGFPPVYTELVGAQMLAHAFPSENAICGENGGGGNRTRARFHPESPHLRQIRGRPACEIVPGPLETPCWIWQGCLNSKGYATRTVEGETYLVHRLVLAERHGDLADAEAHHECRNRACVNPDHLRAVTALEHAAAHSGSRGLVLDALALHRDGLSPKAIATETGLTVGAVHQALRRSVGRGEIERRGHGEYVIAEAST